MTVTSPPGRSPRASADPASTQTASTQAAKRAVPVALALAAASLPMFMSTLDNLVMTSALPVIQRALSADVEQLLWMMNAYTLAFATLMLPAATLGDRFGRRRVFLIGIAVFTFASIGSALSTTTVALIAARTLQGVGAAAIMPLSLTLLAAAVPPARRAMAIGVWGGVSGLGVALGPVIGGAVVDGFSWEAIFWLNVPVAVVAVPLILRALPESHGRRQPLDLVGLALVGVGVLSAVWGIVRAGDLGWGSASVTSALAVGVALIAAFIWHEGRTAYPLVPLRLFRSRSFSVANVAGLAFTLGMFGAVFLLAQYLQIVDGYTPLEAGIRTLPWTAAPMIVAPIAGLLAPRVGVRVLLGLGLTSQALGLAWLAVGAGASTPYADLVPGFILAGVGMGLTFAPSATAVLADMAPHDHATASSTNSTIREIGVALGVAVLVAVFRANGGTLTPTGYDAGLRMAILTGAGVVALGAISTLWLPRATRTLAPAVAPAL
ncbi:MAG TPA: DHA2 family efflux MFS transporter permease subunit [Propionicimonas sp.]